MDAKQCMIVDLQKNGDKQKFITEQVATIRKDANGYWMVSFLSSDRIFRYNPARLLYLTHPDVVNLDGKGLYIRNKQVGNASEVLRFTDGKSIFFRVTYTNGYYENLDGNKVYITRTPLDEKVGSVWEYLRKLVAETGLLAEDGGNLLSRQYDLIDLKRDNVPLAQYLGDQKNLAVYGLPRQVYYPFGCNASQKAAVEAALTHQVSIVQGPPGTGKTQTILNLIANLLVQGKTVLVVSNNNSAVENVAERLDEVGLGFIVAKLGSIQNKEAFVANQPELPDMADWSVDRPADMERSARESLHALSTNFDTQLRQALLKAEYNSLLTETKYNNMLETERAEGAWLQNKPSAKMMRLLLLYQTKIAKGEPPSLFFILRWALRLGWKTLSFLRKEPQKVVAALEAAFYTSRKREMEQALQSLAFTLSPAEIKEKEENLRKASLQMLRSKIAQRYAAHSRRKFTIKEIWPRTEEFLKEYPVILSTTYSAKSCISPHMVFDYMIMDEASQVDIKTGAPCLSCAINVVIVGDDKQLPPVISREEMLVLSAIRRSFSLDDRYDTVTRSFLKSCTEVFKNAPVTLLREHYRCHPKIIEFCNQRFYDGKLVAMTTDNHEQNVLQVIRTAKGNHAREHLNQREIDVIVQEVKPQCKAWDTVGIITPYRQQAEEINKTLGQDAASTVHKYQGRECETVILSTVDNVPTEFSDDTNLLNVAISRAKTRLYVVTNGNEMPPESNLAQLIAYIQYHNFSVEESKLHSVFDLLYKQYTTERLAYAATHSKVSAHLSENLVYNVLLQALSELRLACVDVVCHYPLSRLIADWSLLDQQEKAFAQSPLSHVDFLLYNSLTKQPLLAIEVDGWHFHRKSGVQQSRDILKDGLLTKFGLRPFRISTADTVNVETMKQHLQRLVSKE